MIEELKIIAQMMDGVTDGAVKIAILYLGLKFLQWPVVTSVIGYFSYKVIGVVCNRTFEVVDVSKLPTD